MAISCIERFGRKGCEPRPPSGVGSVLDVILDVILE
ncbi:hypothetical protein E1A91_D10G180200v1 [Gossypium mustelinum]|uniref:Uncharacterized protein n=1 Tax=Gossypium mustelinum TaxID=34275 RepID=A0A5D2TA88_GOSMU|nr:hypothetical protein E1A91_D10G180200v1 [Gossypium mustelinum]